MVTGSSIHHDMASDVPQTIQYGVMLLLLHVIIMGDVHSFGGLLLGDDGLGSTHEGAGLGRGKSTHCNNDLCYTVLNCILWVRSD